MKFICFHSILFICLKSTGRCKNFSTSGLSPLQLWTQGILRADRYSPLNIVLSDDEHFYHGVDGEQELGTGEEEAVVVPETVLSLSDQQINHLHSVS